MRPCFSFSNLKGEGDKPALLTIFDEIGFWGVQAKDFIAQLQSVEASNIDVEINSPGGDTYAGIAMYNALRASGKAITTKAMGVAASAASLVFMAGDKRVMPKNTFLMIHNPWTFTSGNAEELREVADTLEKIGTVVQATYAARSGMDDTKLSEMLSKDTYLTADEALADGFATEVIEEVVAHAKFDLARAELPENVAALFKPRSQQSTEAKEPTEPNDTASTATSATSESGETPFGETVTTLAKEAGFESYAPTWALSLTKVDDVKAAIASAREIKSLCEAVGMADKAHAFITESKSIADVRSTLAEAKAKADEDTHVDTTQSSSNQPTTSASQSAVKTADIWAKRQQLTQRK